MNLSGKLTKTQKQAINYFADNLLSQQMKQNIRIRVKFTENIDNFGETEITDYNSIGRPREFTLIIKKDIGEKETLKTLSHEMVHVRQYCYGHLNEQMTYWRGKKVSEEDYEYFDRPWEKEANQTGNTIFEEYEIYTKRKI